MQKCPSSPTCFIFAICRLSSCYVFPIHSHKKTRTLFHWRVFPRNSNSMEILFHFHLDSNTMIDTKFCTWHDSCTVVACAKICCDLMASNGITARQNFHRIWIAGKKIVSETGPWSHWVSGWLAVSCTALSTWIDFNPSWISNYS